MHPRSEPQTDQPTLGRRARNRAARQDQLLAAASDIVEEAGLDGLTMQGVADRVDCAVGTIYTYFSSKSALIAALQTAAVQRLLATYHLAAENWDRWFEDAGAADEAVEALVRVLAYGQLFVAAPELHPREYELLQLAINSPERMVSSDDVHAITPHALALLAEGLVLVNAAVGAGALSAPDTSREDDGLRRLLRWIGALDGALLVANANVTAIPAAEVASFEPRRLAQLVTEDLLLAWGAPPNILRAARDQLDRMRRAGALIPTLSTSG
ncbi:MAG: TetR/AcrR family transcriptional regulator [Actinobacteria bacterium]|nr:TetR/AcrR family transcriptional regulator [Actinomycetota bacterium]